MEAATAPTEAPEPRPATASGTIAADDGDMDGLGVDYGSDFDSDAAEDDDDDNDDCQEGSPSGDRPSLNERPKRRRSSTVIHVKGGFTIRKDNNYVLKGGSYAFGVADDQIVASRRASHPGQTATVRPSRKAAKTSAGAAAVASSRRPASAAEARRRQLKRDIEAAVLVKRPLRDAFLRKHLPALAPFLDDKVRAAIEQAPTSKQAQTKALQVAMQPDAIQAELRDYQLEGLQFMARMHAHNVGMILGDEMGLGKTIQSISMVCYLKEQYESKGPSLVVCPMSVLYSWCDEIKKWAPSLSFLRFHVSDTNDTSMHEHDLSQFDMVVTTYEMVRAPSLARLWQRQAFHLLVLDEGHRIKCAETQTAQAVRKIHAENRIILTGTPLANNLVELHSLLNFLAPDVVIAREPFAGAFDLNQNVVDAGRLAQAHDLLSVFMLRRLKERVEKLIPRNLETKVVCPMSTTQIWWYKAILLKDINILASGGTGKGGLLANLIMQLRKCCLHPYLFDGAEDIESTSLEALVGASGKLTVLDKLLCSLYEKQHRVCLFSQFTQMLDILEDYCVLRGWKFCRFDGATARAKRNYVVNSFNAPDSDKFLFLMSTRSGGMGLNLQTADTVILYDSDWNPQPDIQAMARVCRIGQTKVVHTYRLVTEGTVEERMIERAQKKLYMDRMVMRDGSDGGDYSSQPTGSEDAQDLMATLKFGCGAVFDQGASRNTIPSDADIEIITDRSRSEDFSHGNLQGGSHTTAGSFDATKTLLSTSEFAGIDFSEIRKQYQKQKRPNSMVDICVVWQKKRQSKQRVKMMDAKGSGYGSAAVPVLTSNDYDIETGERSVFQRELRNEAHQFNKKKEKDTFEHQEHCQVCGDGGELVMCPRCPVCVHVHCAGVKTAKHFACCSHHHCAVCDKAASAVGGFIFPCSACTMAFCEDHLPCDAKFLEPCQRIESLGYVHKLGVYIHCSRECERFAMHELGYRLAIRQGRDPCPPKLDVSEHFGGEVDESLEAPEELILYHKRERKPVQQAIEVVAASAPKSFAQFDCPDDDGSDDDFSYRSDPMQAQKPKRSSEWQDAVASQKMVEVHIDGVPHPVMASGKPKSSSLRGAGDKSSPPLVGEYDVQLPVINGRLGLRIGQIGDYVCLTARCLSTLPGSVARDRAIRNVGDVLVQIEGRCIQGKDISDVIQMISNSSYGKQCMVLRFFDQTASRYGFKPFVGASKEPLTGAAASDTVSVSKQAAMDSVSVLSYTVPSCASEPVPRDTLPHRISDD